VPFRGLGDFLTRRATASLLWDAGGVTFSRLCDFEGAVCWVVYRREVFPNSGAREGQGVGKFFRIGVMERMIAYISRRLRKVFGRAERQFLFFLDVMIGVVRFCGAVFLFRRRRDAAWKQLAGHKLGMSEMQAGNIPTQETALSIAQWQAGEVACPLMEVSYGTRLDGHF